MPFVRADRLPPTASVVDAVFDNFEDAAETSGWESLRAIFKTTPEPEYPKGIGFDGLKDYHIHRHGYAVPRDVQYAGGGQAALGRYFGAAIAAGVATALYADKFLDLNAEERRKLRKLSASIATDAETLRKKLGAWFGRWMYGWIETQVRSAQWRKFYGLKLQAGAKYLVAKER